MSDAKNLKEGTAAVINHFPLEKNEDGSTKVPENNLELPSFNLSKFEKLVFSDSTSDHLEALTTFTKYFTTCLMSNWTLGEVKGLNKSDVKLASINPERFVFKAQSRLAKRIIELIFNLKEINNEIEVRLILLLNRKAILSALLCSTIHGNTDHYVNALIHQHNNNKDRDLLEVKKLFALKLSLLYCLNSDLHIEKIFHLFKDNRHFLGNFCMGLLSENFVANENAKRNKDWLLTNLPSAIDAYEQDFLNYNEKALILNPVCSAYMFCSYSSIKNQNRHILIQMNLLKDLKEYWDQTKR